MSYPDGRSPHPASQEQGQISESSRLIAQKAVQTVGAIVERCVSQKVSLPHAALSIGGPEPHQPVIKFLLVPSGDTTPNVLVVTPGQTDRVFSKWRIYDQPNRPQDLWREVPTGQAVQQGQQIKPGATFTEYLSQVIATTYRSARVINSLPIHARLPDIPGQTVQQSARRERATSSSFGSEGILRFIDDLEQKIAALFSPGRPSRPPTTPATPVIRWGQEVGGNTSTGDRAARTGIAERAESATRKEFLSLEEKIQLIKPLLSTYSSRDKERVPACYAYMRILGRKINDLAGQRSLLDQALREAAPKADAAGWVKAGDLVHESGGEEMVISRANNTVKVTTALPQLDLLAEYWRAEAGREFTSENEQSLKVPLGRQENRASVISTAVPIRGTVISAEPTNPFWRRANETPPRVGGTFTCMGLHALLVIDAPIVVRNGVRQRDFVMVDPQTGTVFQVTQDYIYNASIDAAKLDVDRRKGELTPGQASWDAVLIRAGFEVGACWTGRSQPSQ